MAIYKAPSEFTLPFLSYDSKIEFRERLNQLREAEQNYINALVEWCKQRSVDKYAGEIVQFQVADGYALYMVVTLSPIKLIHLELGDAYQFEYAHRLTKKDIIDKINQQKSLAKLFGGQQK